MLDAFSKPPVRVDGVPTLGPPLLVIQQMRPSDRRELPTDLPPWVLPIQRRLDTILRQQDEILYHLQHPWRVRWVRLRAALAHVWSRLQE